jgi:F420-dependent oxidoreductase-like protein
VHLAAEAVGRPATYSACMRIGLWIGGNRLEDFVDSARQAKEAGFPSVWAGQIFGLDTLTAFAVAGREVRGLEWGTGVIPIYPRHPIALAMQALTTNAAVDGRLTLGIGPSHQVVIEALHGLDYSRPASYTEEYLHALLPLLREGKVSFAGSQVTAHITLDPDKAFGVPVLLSALAPRMLRLAGAVADGTVTWMTGPKTVTTHVVPSIRAAAKEAGRPEPRVVMALPVAVTDDVAQARARAGEIFSVYGGLPAYRAVLDREGAEGPGDVVIAGDVATVRTQIADLGEGGVTEFVAVTFTERERTVSALQELL